MEIDNFDVLMSHIDFVDPNDRYIVHILRRPKDCKELAQIVGSNEAQRKIRSYCIDSIEYLQRKKDAIKELCNSCRARANLVVQPKDNFECLLNLGKKILDTIQKKNYSVKPERLLWTAYGETHNSRKKQWIIDLDMDSMQERWIENNFGGKSFWCREWTVDEVSELIKNQVSSCDRNPDDVYWVPTKNGWHIITPPFNLKEAQEKCRLLFEGVKNMPIKCEEKWRKPGEKGYAGSPGLDKYYDIEEKQTVGWLHKDGMTLLYAPETI